MRLKSIEMQGFKSFPDKTKIAFDSGVTAIIGPNGSGKSNISDAVRWVLGEMSLKSLRGSKMEDVIFNGAAGRTPSNCSSVSITFDTQDEYYDYKNLVISIDDTIKSSEESASEEKNVTAAAKMRLSDNKEVTVTRKYYRSGESEYYINKTQVRLKDVYELFYDTGIGREGYSVIGQGKISEVLSQKGDERRSIFEEAAGISKFRYKKTEAERKLKETENNLLRINDILNEVSSRIGPLAKEAENAKQYLVLSEEKKGLEITLWLGRIDDIKSELSKGEIAFNSAKYNLEQTEEKEKNLESSLDNIINETYELSRRISETEQKKSDAGQRSSGIEGKKAVLLNDISHFTRVIEENALLKESAEKDIEAADSQLDVLIAASADFDKELALLSSKLELTQSAYEAKHTEATNSLSELENANNEYNDLVQKNANIMSTGAVIDTQIELAGRSKDELSVNIANSQSRIAELQSELDGFVLNESDYRIQYNDILKEKSAKDEEIASILRRIEKIKEEIVACRLSLASDEQKREHLTRLEQLFEGYSDSVRSVLNDAKQGKIRYNGKNIGLHGTVSSIMSTDGEYVVALETALAASVQFIVVDSEDDAKAAIKYLKDNRLGRATFLPLTTVKGRKFDVENIKNLQGYIGIASELAKFDKKYEGIIDDLLGRTVIASDIDAATRIAAKTGYKVKIVTIDGQVINPGGSFTGGSAAKKVGLLTRAADIERLSAQIKEKSTELLKKEREVSVAQKTINDSQAEISLLEQSMAEKKSELDSLVASRNTCHTRLDEEKNKLQSLSSNRGDGETKYADLVRQKEQFAVTAAELSKKLEDSKQKLTDLKQKSDALRASEEEEYRNLNTEKIQLLEKRTEADRFKSLIKQSQDKKTQALSRISELEILSHKAEEDIRISREEIENLEKDKQNILDEANRYLSEMQALLSAREKKEKQTADIRAAIKNTLSQKEEAFRLYTSLEAKQTKLNSDYEDISSKLWDEYEMTYSAAAVFRLPEDKMQKAPARLAALKSKIRAMGSINVNAVEEYRQEKERFDFLSAQTEDLNKTRRSLDNALAKLNTEMRQTFLECFDKINKEFGKVFTWLFGGGSAYIELADPELPLECGIDIIIKPPGKSVRSISLLSGGEQSFAAIALYLALQKINPAPFCIFDEIESALDDVNLAKFADYVRENSEKTQYILITHRRGTMERADTLYGITMRQKGISEYIKLNIAMLQENLKEYTG